MNVIELIAIYILIMNIMGFASMGIDKRRAVKRAWRIPEATLFTLAIFGGSLGSTIGMFFFHHKTRHWYFAYGMPIILIIHIGLIVALYVSPLQIAFL